jgi:hypothetical protein
MTTYQKLVLKALAQILRIISSHRPSLEDLLNCGYTAKEITDELNRKE